MESSQTEQRPLLESHAFGETNESTDEDTQLFDSLESREALERSLLKKVDRRMSMLVVIYILNYMDRNSVSAARLRGFEEDLHLEGTQFATVLSVLYIGYVSMQIPSNMFLNHIGKPSLYLPGCMVIWGGLSICTGFTTNFIGALTTRFFLGFAEAAFFPGALFLISKWYKRNELSQRTALLACGILVSNAFGSLIAAGILDLTDGLFGFAAWRWLFFVEGGLTILVAICAMFILPDFPETPVTWLTPAEAKLAQSRIAEEAGHSPLQRHQQTQVLAKDGLILAISDWKVWWLTGTLLAMVAALSFGVYFPTLAATMGYNTTKTLLLCVPPWIFATVTTVLVSRHSDEVEERCFHIVTPLAFGVIGFILSMITMNTLIRYLSLFLMAQTYAGFICCLAWISNSVSQPPAKRAVALALINCISQLGNVFGSYIWPVKWSPSYFSSYGICMLMSVVSILMCLVFRMHLRDLNRQAEAMEGLGVAGRTRHRYLL